MIDIPKTREVALCDAERFAIGLRQLCDECNVAQWSLDKTYFADGSTVGNRYLYEFALHIRELD